MKQQQPIILYIFITVLVFIGLTVAVVVIKSYLSEKFFNKETKQQDKIKGEELPEETQLSNVIFKVAGIVFLTLIIIFVTVKLAVKQPK